MRAIHQILRKVAKFSRLRTSYSPKYQQKSTLANDASKTVVLLVNDYNREFDEAAKKLSKILKRNLQGFVLVDKKIKDEKLNKQILGSSFQEIVCDFHNPSSIITALKPIAEKLLVVNASSERNQPYYKLLIPHIPYINTTSESSLEWTTLKDKMRLHLNSYDKSLSPNFIKLSEKNEKNIVEVIKNLKFPVISKPVGLAASVLVKKSYDVKSLRYNLESSFDNITKIHKTTRGRGLPELIVEEFIEGGMFSVDAYVNSEGKVWSLPPIKVTTAASIGLEGYYSYRNDSLHGLNKAEINAAEEVAKRAVHALSLKSSAAHIELFKTRNGWKIIELGPRAGGYRQDMYWYAYGIDHALNELLVKIGLEPTVRKDLIAHSAIFNVYAEQEGIIDKILGIEESRNIESVKWIEQHAKIGDRAIFCGNGGLLLVDGVLANSSFQRLDEDMKKIRELIKITVTKKS